MSFIPNTTPTPNWLYNGEMKKMRETELKVVLLVTRKTLGWFDPLTNERKNQDYISQSQFMEFTGQSHTAIAQAIQKSVEMGWIIARDRNGNVCDTPEKRRRRKCWYQLGTVFTKKISKQESGLDENLSNISAKSKQHSGTHLSKKVDNTKETITKETITKETIQKIATPSVAIVPPTKKAPFNWVEYLAILDEDKREYIQLIAYYLRRREIVFDTHAEVKIALARHSKAACAVVKFGKKKVFAAMDVCDEEARRLGYEWSLETVIKKLTNK